MTRSADQWGPPPKLPGDHFVNALVYSDPEIFREEQEKIFDKFYRCGDPLVHNIKGSGLGLSLVRHIARAHCGDVLVESTPDKGSKFTIALPLDPPGVRTAQAAA